MHAVDVDPPVIRVCCPKSQVFEDLAAGHFRVEHRGAREPEGNSTGGLWALVVRSESLVDGETLRLHPGLRVVVRAGTGLDNIDVGCAVARGIAVRAIPGVSARDVAELALALMFSLLRLIVPASAACRRGDAGKEHFVGCRCKGKTMGILGCGRIGTELGRMARAVGMRVLGVVKCPAGRRRQELAREGIELVSVEHLLTLSDVVVNCLPHSEETRELLDKAALLQMPPGSFLVNVGRASVMNGADVVAMLNSGHLAGVACDVYDAVIASCEHPRLLRTPHIGAMTTTAQDTIAEQAIQILMEEYRKERTSATNISD